MSYQSIDIAFDLETVALDVSPELESELFAGIALSPISPPTTKKDKENPEAYYEKKELEQAEKLDEKKREIQAGYALSPLTGRVACICIYGQNISERIVFEDESLIISGFWAALARLSSGRSLRFISFNGKQFDAWFLKVRSAVHGIKPTVRIDTRRFYSEQHFDVREILTNFGQQNKGKLGQWAHAFGVAPKISEGAAVAEMWKNKEYDKLTDYCLQDCITTYELYQKLRDYV